LFGFIIATLAAPIARAGDPIQVCLAAGGALRVVERESECGPDERELKLAEWEPETAEPPENEEKHDTGDLEKQIEKLEQRVAELEEQDTDRKREAYVSAPFEVRDRSGNAIFRVTEEALASDPAPVSIAKSGGGGRLEVRGGSGTVTLEQPEGRGLALRFAASTTTVAAIGFDGAGDGRVQLGGDGQRATVGLWGGGTQGSVDVYGSNDAPLVSMNSADLGGDGILVVRNDSGIAVAHLTGSSQGGGGNVTVADPAGNGMFSAGWNGEEGLACANLKSGMWCMGKNLPLTH
jgi:hypothetical protein